MATATETAKFLNDMQQCWSALTGLSLGKFRHDDFPMEYRLMMARAMRRCADRIEQFAISENQAGNLSEAERDLLLRLMIGEDEEQRPAARAALRKEVA